jgi:hypothetical protein
MKLKIFIAFLIYIFASIKIIDWFIFWYKNNGLTHLTWAELKLLYISRFPDNMRFLFEGYPEPATLLSIVFLVISGLIFLQQNTKVYKVISVSAFILAALNVWSLL